MCYLWMCILAVCWIRTDAAWTSGGAASFLDDEQEIDFLQAIKIPFESSNLFFVSGSNGFPAFGMKPGSDVKVPHRLYVPERLFPQFSIWFVLRLESPDGGGFLFAIVNPLETIVQLGVSVKVQNEENSNVTLYYTDVNIGGHYTSHVLASFRVRTSFTQFTPVTLAVRDDRVDISLNCVHQESIEVTKIPQELNFDAASTLYIGQAGPIIKEPLYVSKIIIICYKSKHRAIIRRFLMYLMPT